MKNYYPFCNVIYILVFASCYTIIITVVVAVDVVVIVVAVCLIVFVGFLFHFLLYAGKPATVIYCH